MAIVLKIQDLHKHYRSFTLIGLMAGFLAIPLGQTVEIQLESGKETSASNRRSLAARRSGKMLIVVDSTR